MQRKKKNPAVRKTCMTFFSSVNAVWNTQHHLFFMVLLQNLGSSSLPRTGFFQFEEINLVQLK